MASEDCDDTTKLVPQIQLDNSTEPKDQNSPKSNSDADNDGKSQDEFLDIDVYVSQLASQLQLNNDDTMCKNIPEAVSEDTFLLGQNSAEEARDRRAREVAEFLDEEYTAPSLLHPPSPETDRYISDDELRQFDLPNRNGVEVEEHVGKGGSLDVLEDGRVKCNSCLGLFDKAVAQDKGATQTPCGHIYCGNCIRELFLHAVNNEQLFPPRCCKQPIPFTPAVRRNLNMAEVGLFLAKELEYSTPSRTYCHDPACSSFIPPAFIMEAVSMAKCHRCHKSTCTECKGPVHEEQVCPENKADKELLTVAKEHGWMRCPSCRNLVELNTGCNHMTCRCKAEFCYQCGLVWKSCHCALWEEERLFANAAAVVGRDRAALGLDVMQRNVRVQRMRNHLVDNQDWENHHWRFRRGMFQCSECGDVMHEFIYECRSCYIMACRRCRYNNI